jgi:SAM-dependent methyltransferase
LHAKEDGAVSAERDRILEENRRRARENARDLYAPWQPANLFLGIGRRRTAARLLHDAGVFPAAGDPCLEVGFALRGWLGDLLCWGVREGDLHGIELDPARAAHAREILPHADLRVGDATSLPWTNGEFRLVVTSTLFSSILDPGVRLRVAEEVTRVLAPGGALLWYDLAVNNPRNPNVRKVDRTELRRLFPSLHGRVRSVSLAPPLARLVAPWSWLAATALETIPFLRTHVMAVLVKGS